MQVIIYQLSDIISVGIIIRNKNSIVQFQNARMLLRVIRRFSPKRYLTAIRE